MEFKFSSQENLVEYIKKGLEKYNKKSGVELYADNERIGQKIGFEVTENGEFIAGISGKIAVFDYLHISLLYVEEKFRGRKIGTKLVEKMEEYAKQNNLNALTLNTFDFQAKDFYLKLGYKIYGQFTDKKTNVTRYSLIKELN